AKSRPNGKLIHNSILNGPYVRRMIPEPGDANRDVNMVRGNGGNQFRQYARQNAGNPNGYNAVQNVRNQVAPNLRVQNVRNQNGLIGVQGNGNQNQIGNDGLAEVHENYDNNEIFNMFIQEDQYTELLEPIPELQQVPQNDNNVISEVTDVE
nr:hypothetical protein [Tanacetum cinerariifolium]